MARVRLCTHKIFAIHLFVKQIWEKDYCYCGNTCHNAETPEDLLRATRALQINILENRVRKLGFWALFAKTDSPFDFVHYGNPAYRFSIFAYFWLFDIHYNFTVYID